MPTEAPRVRTTFRFGLASPLSAWVRGRARSRNRGRAPRTTVTGTLTAGVLGSDPSAAALLGQFVPARTKR